MSGELGVMERSVAQMGRMGYGRDVAVAALTRHDGNLHAAIDELLTNPPPIPAPKHRTAMEPEPEAPGGACSPPEASGGSSGRLRQRLAHQTATLKMLRDAGAAEEELDALLKDVEALQVRVAEHESTELAKQQARDAAARAQRELAERRARDAQRREDLERREEELKAQEDRAALAELARQQDAQIRAEEAARELLKAKVDDEIRANAAAQAAQEATTQCLYQSCIATEYCATFDEPVEETDEAGVQFTAYPVTVITPHKTYQICKRFTDFENLKVALGETGKAKEVKLADTPFPSKTWTSWLMKDGDGVAQERREVLSVWLNVVLLMCSESAPVVSFVCGDEGLLQSVDDLPGES